MIQGQPGKKRSVWARGVRGPAALACSALFPVLLTFGAACSSAQERVDNGDLKARAELDLGRDAYDHGRLREALGHVQASLRIDETNPEAHYFASFIFLAFCAADETSTDCRFAEAERHARAALESAPEMRDAKNALGVILVHQKKYDEAVAVLKPLAEDILYASPEQAWGNLGWAYLSRGSIDEAIDALRRALAAQPMFCVGSYRLGQAYEKKGELVLAREAFTKALETDKPQCRNLQDGFAARARVAEKLGQRELAREDRERCRDVAPATVTGKRCAVELGSQ